MTTDEQFHVSLHKILDRLGKSDWSEPLLDLEQKLAKVPEEDSFRVELLNMLLHLQDSTVSDPGLPLTQLAAIRLSHLTCWNYRFVKTDQNGKHYLDPLSEDRSTFNTSLDVFLANSAYPAQDIVKRWARDHLV